MKGKILICFAFIVVHAVGYVESGILVTSPRIYRAGSTQELPVGLFSEPAPWVVNATLTHSDRGDVSIIASDEAQFTSHSDGTLKLKIPKPLFAHGKTYSSMRGKLTVHGGPVDGKRNFLSSEVVTIETPKSSMFIQTDKPIYKPGQTVNIRIVGTDEDLKPLKEKLSRVTVLNPSKVRIMQWENLDFAVGIVSLKFPLSSQPDLGNWKIEALYKDQTKTEGFKVDKYVLPKFEVTITPPPFVARRGNNNITATICAQYTYGQPVKGKVSVIFALKSRHNNWIKCQTTVKDKINGCKDISTSPGLLCLSTREFTHGYHNPYDQSKITIKATVKETATNISLNATETETEVVRETTKLKFLSSTPTSFKRGMPFTGQVQATLIDGSPLKGESVEISVRAKKRSQYCSWYKSYWQWGRQCKEVFRKSFTVPADGIINFVVPGSQISMETSSMELKASYKSSSVTFSVEKPWFSPSQSYIEMAKFTSPQVVGSTAKVMFEFTANTRTENITFHYQVFSRGLLVAQGRKFHRVEHNITKSRKEPIVGHSFTEFLVTHKMVPSCRILLFYVRDDSETVAANMEMEVEGTLENEVNISFANTVRKPGEQTRLIIKAAQGSQVAISAVDKSVHLLKGGNELTEADAIDALRSLDVGPSTDYWTRNPCIQRWPFKRRKRSMLPYGGYGNDLDASEAFKDSGVIHFSDLKIKTAKCNNRYAPVPVRRTMFSRGPFGAWPFVSRRSGGSSYGLQTVSHRRRTPQAMKRKSSKQKGNQKPLNVRREFPETWLWTEETINEKTGMMVLSVKVPDTITSWVASAFAMSNSSGLGISKPTTLKVFQPFFVSLTLPYSVIRGEEVSIIATVFNYESKCLTVLLSLEYSLDYDVMSNYSQVICVCSKEAKSVHFRIVPKKLGQLPLAVAAKDIPSSACGNTSEQIHLGVSDAVIRNLLVEPEGVRQEYTYNSFVCLKDRSFFKDNIELPLPQNIVPGSVYAMISTVGDLMGPALNVETLLRLPYGCGEQNMVNFAPSIYIMKYLSTLGQLDKTIENKAKNIMRTGYQRELTYKRDDGSYSAFGKRDSEGNMWLTAFVLRSFAQAQPFIFVDSSELTTIQKWITRKQQKDGCFPKHGRLFNKLLKGGVGTEATLTAFVTVSLLESGMSRKDETIHRALNCLRSKISNLTDSYSLALFAYTFTLAKDPSYIDLLASLKDNAIIEDGLMHWEKVKEVSTPRENGFRWWNPYNRARGADIEMTAYALMTYTLLAETDSSLIGQAMPIVKWLTKQRNALGGFASTQDTCVALQALSKYASKVYSNTTSLTVQVGKKAEQQFRASFIITDENRLVSQRAEIPSTILPIKELPFKVTGEGCALIQADVSYNIPDVKDEPAFDLNVTLKLSDDVFGPMATAAGEILCLPLEMSITAEWLEEDTSNMAVIDVKLVSGYEADEDSLKELLKTPSLGLKRYEMEGQHVILYFDEIDKVSFMFKIYQSTVVKKTKPAAVTVYDYYETHLSATVMYEITDDLCGPDEIQ
ncbi:alpha-2-macroglobulin-like isoform X2 [Montipora capricornis]|uniref:alpha-2-macroglobulin-like isoform X2 n=1 Tax=Montipora capricornis TaxID=246305 RepID=UPI0035F12EE3